VLIKSTMQFEMFCCISICQLMGLILNIAHKYNLMMGNLYKK